MAVEGRGQRAQRQARVRDEHERDAGGERRIGLTLGDDGDGAARGGRGGVTVAVLAPAGHRHEQGAGARGPRVMGHALHPDVVGRRRDPGFAEQVAQANHVAAV